MDGITFVALPYDSGRFDERMGRGPFHLLDGGLAERLRAQKHDVEVITIRLSESFHAEGEALVELQKLAAPVIRDAIARKRRALILSGNCGPAALSAVCGLNPRTTGVVWFDAHADFNTPETSASGFLDGMALSILTGHCWPALAARFIGFEPVRAENVILAGARELDPAEALALRQSGITHIAPRSIVTLARAVEALAARVENFYLHLDVDVLDESEGRANSYASGGGLSADELYAALRLLKRSGRIRLASITSYDPACDRRGSISAIVDGAAAVISNRSGQSGGF